MKDLLTQANAVEARLREEYGGEWKQIDGFCGNYFASTMGQVYSVPRAKTTGGILNKQPASGYLRVFLSDGFGTKKYHLLHRIILSTFCGPSADLDVRHLDGNPLNNKLSNLQYGTPLQNASDREAHGRHRKGESVVKAKLNWDDVQAIRNLKGVVEQRDLAYRFSVARTTIQRIQSGKLWAAQH